MNSIIDLLQFSSKKKVPIILQTEMAECGLACLAMVAGYYGHKYDLVGLRRKHAIPLTGATLKSIISIADQINLVARPIKADLDQLIGMRLPAILHWDMSHFVVLESVSTDKIRIYDPACGIREYSAEEASKHFTGIALELSPTKDFEEDDERTKIRLSDFWGKIQGLNLSLTQVIIVSLVLQVFAVTSPLYLQLVVDEAILSRDTNFLLVLSLGFLLLMIIQISIEMFRSYLILVMNNLLNIQMADNIFRHLMRLPMTYFQNRHIGDVISRFDSQNSIREFLTSGFVEAIVDGLFSICMLVMLFLYSPMLALTVIGVVLIYLIVRLIYYKPLRRHTEDSINKKASEQSVFMETVRGIQPIKLFCNELERQAVWRNRLAEVINANIRIGKLNIGFAFTSGALWGLENILVIYIGASLIMDNQFTVGMLYAFLSYKTRFIQSSQTLIEKFIQYKMLYLHLERLSDITRTRIEKYEQSEELKDFQLIGAIELRDIGFRFSTNDNYIFDSINLKVEAGEVIAITGPSGCGKSTLLKIMVGLIPASRGNVIIDSKKMDAIGAKHFRNQISAVMQNDTLFSGSLLDNISFFDTRPDKNHAIECAKIACIHDEIMCMPMQYETLVGDMGTTLSGGQLQRVLLARALYKRPKILFLDESTSHLDAKNETRINENLSKLKMTRVIIAHRESTIKLASRVFTFFNSELLEVEKDELFI